MSVSFPRHLLKWLLGLNLSIPLKNVKRDFANGFLIAEICARYHPSEFGMHSYENVVSNERKASNWLILERSFKKLGFPISLQLCASVRAAKLEAAAEQLVQTLYDHLEKMKQVESTPQTETLVLVVPDSPPPEPEPAPLDLHVPAATQLTKGKGSSKTGTGRLSSKSAPTVKFADETEARPSTRGNKASTLGTQPADIVALESPVTELATSAASVKGGGSQGSAAADAPKERPEWRETGGVKKRILGTTAVRHGPALAKSGSKRLSNTGSATMQEAQAVESRQLSGISATTSISQQAPADLRAAAAAATQPAAGAQEVDGPAEDQAGAAKPAHRRMPAGRPVERPPWQTYERKQLSKGKAVAISTEAAEQLVQQAEVSSQLLQAQHGEPAPAGRQPAQGLPAGAGSPSGHGQAPSAALHQEAGLMPSSTSTTMSHPPDEPLPAASQQQGSLLCAPGQASLLHMQPDVCAQPTDTAPEATLSPSAAAPNSTEDLPATQASPAVGALPQQQQPALLGQQPSLYFDKQGRKVRDFQPYAPETYLGQEYMDAKRSKYWQLGGLGMDDSPAAQAKREMAKQLKDMSMAVRAQNLEALRSAPAPERPASKESAVQRAKAYSKSIQRPAAYEEPEPSLHEESSAASSAHANSAAPELLLLEQQHAMDQQALGQIRGLHLAAI